MYTRAWNPESQGDYELLARWSAGHGKDAMPREGLPRLGVFVGERGVMGELGPLVACAFVYKDQDAPTGWLGFLTTAPGLGPKKALRACKAAIEAAEELARRIGVRYIFINAESAGYVRLLRRHGWAVNHEVNLELCKDLKGGGQ